jgi:hypothetical protein
MTSRHVLSEVEGCRKRHKTDVGFIDGSKSNVLISAPEAQCLLAPRFSVGKADSTD